MFRCNSLCRFWLAPFICYFTLETKCQTHIRANIVTIFGELTVFFISLSNDESIADFCYFGQSMSRAITHRVFVYAGPDVRTNIVNQLTNLIPIKLLSNIPPLRRAAKDAVEFPKTYFSTEEH